MLCQNEPGVSSGEDAMVLPVAAALGPVRPHAPLVQLPDGFGVPSRSPVHQTSLASSVLARSGHICKVVPDARDGIDISQDL